MGTRKTTKGTSTNLSTSMADLGSVIRLNPNNFDTSSFGFVLDKALQLVETPITNPIIQSLASSLFSYSFEVFHYDLVSFEVGNYVFAYVVVNPSHVTCFSAANFFQQSLGGSSAFGLKSRTQVFEFPLDLLNFRRVVEFAVACDCEVVYSEVNSENRSMRSIVHSFDLFGEREQKETSAFSVNTQETLTNFPIGEVFFVTFRNCDVEFLSVFEQSQTQNIIIERSRTGKVVTDRSSPYLWFGFGFLDYTTSLLDTSYGELCRQSLSDVCVNNGVKFDIIPYLVFPSNVNAALQADSVHRQGFDYFGSGFDTDFCSNYATHTTTMRKQIYIADERGSPVDSGNSSPHRL